MRNFILIYKWVLCLSLVIFSCRGTFIPDPIDPQLPKYTEEGNNVAGALIGSETWRSVVQYDLFTSDYTPDIFSFPSGDSITLVFNGEVAPLRSSIEFHLSNLKINSIEDLLILNDKKIQLDGIRNSGCYSFNNYPGQYSKKGLGQIYFKKITQKDSVSLTLSGTFGFSTGDNIKISYGRFDYKISAYHLKINF